MSVEDGVECKAIGPARCEVSDVQVVEFGVLTTPRKQRLFQIGLLQLWHQSLQIQVNLEIQTKKSVLSRPKMSSFCFLPANVE